MATIQSLNNLIVFQNSQGVQARGNLVKVSRTTLILEVYNPYSIVQLSEVLHDLEIRSNDRVIYSGRAVVSGLVNTGLMLIVSASLLDPWSELIALAGDSETIQEEISEFIAEWESSQKITPEYQLVVAKMRSFLAAINRWLEHLDFNEPPGLYDRSSKDYDFSSDLEQSLVPTLIDLFQEFERQASAVDENERFTHLHHAQDNLHPLLMRAPFVHRTYQKPLGYAGDYEMVNMMLRDPREGPTVYSRLINTFYLSTGPVRAHQNRIKILVEWLKKNILQLKAREIQHKPRILSVGCGPAIEWQRIIAQGGEFDDCNVTLVDFSQETLGYAEQQLKEARVTGGGNPSIEFMHQSVHGLLRQASRADEQDPSSEYDLIYCAGLFDYLSDRVCKRLINLFNNWASKNGRILVTNVHPSNPSRYGMEHLLEWYLIYRDEAGMEKLGDAFENSRIFADETGINIFLEILG